LPAAAAGELVDGADDEDELHAASAEAPPSMTAPMPV